MEPRNDDDRPKGEEMARVLGLVAVLVAGCLDAQPEADITENKWILAGLPVPAGAGRIEVRSAAYYEDRGGPPKGHTTTAVYLAPRDVSAEEVVDFYAARLGGWRCQMENPAALLLHCTHGTALVSINTDNMTTDRPRFEVVVDHQGNR